MTEAPRIHRWTTPGLGSVHTFWIEGRDGIVVIDGQRELSKAREARIEMGAVGKPVVAVILTHPQPDHFGGLGVFAPKGSGIPVLGSARTRDSMAEDRFGLVKASHEAVKDDFPAEVTLPDSLVGDGEVVHAAGLTFELHEWGAGEAECMTIVHLPSARALFCADVVQDGMTAFLLEGRSGAWLDQLTRLGAAFPDVEILYPGHGEPGIPAALIARQVAYLDHFRSLVAAELRSGALPAGADARIAAAMEARYPGYQPVAAIPDLLRMDAAPVAKELAEAASGRG